MSHWYVPKGKKGKTSLCDSCAKKLDVTIGNEVKHYCKGTLKLRPFMAEQCDLYKNKRACAGDWNLKRGR